MPIAEARMVSLSGYHLTIAAPRHFPTVGSHPADPFVHRLPNGALLAHGEFCDCWSYQSIDHGRNWDLLPWGMGCSIVNCRDGTVVAMDYLTYPIDGIAGQFNARGRRIVPDYRHPGDPLQVTLNIPGAIPMIDDQGLYGGGPSFWRSMVEEEDGTLLATGYGNFAHNDAPPLGYPRDWGMRRFESLVMESRDRGATWHLRGMIASDRETGQEGFCEPVMIDLGRGELLAVMRTGRSSPLYQARSLDRGYTWGRPESLRVPGVDPSLLSLADGTVVLGWGTRIPDAPWDSINIEDYQRRYVEGQGDPPLVRGGYVAFSRDGGRTYSAPLMLDDGVGQGYTALAESTPGELLFAIRHNWRKHTPTDWLVGEGRSALYPITMRPEG